MSRDADPRRLTMPSGIRVPVPHGGRITAAFASPSVATVSLVYPFEDHDRLVAFYDAVLAGWESSGRADADSTRYEYCSGSDTVVIYACVDTESDGFDIDATCLVITQAP